MSYLNRTLPDCVAHGATFAPRFSTTIVTVSSGQEHRNQNWSHPLMVGEVGYKVLTYEQTQELVDFMYDAGGRARSFRVKDWSDYTANGRGVLVDTGGGAWQMGKTYGTGSRLTTRMITKPVSGTVRVFDAGGVELPAAAWTVDYETGKVQAHGYTPAGQSVPVLGVASAPYQTFVALGDMTGFTVGQTVEFTGMAGATELEGVQTTISAIYEGGFFCGIDPASFSAFYSGFIKGEDAGSVAIADIDLSQYLYAAVLATDTPPAVGTVVTLGGMTGDGAALNGTTGTVTLAMEEDEDAWMVYISSATPSGEFEDAGTLTAGGASWPAAGMMGLGDGFPIITTATPHGVELNEALPIVLAGIGGAVELNGLATGAAFATTKMAVLSHLNSEISPYTGGGTVGGESTYIPIGAISQYAQAALFTLPSGHGLTVGQSYELGVDFQGATELNGRSATVLQTTETTALLWIGVAVSPYTGGGSVITQAGTPQPAPTPTSWEGEFDVQARFDSDEIAAQANHSGPAGVYYDWPSIPLQEVRA